jgi:hypothetical protein
MRPNNKQLGYRDPAMMALMLGGAIHGSDFGADWERSRFSGSEFGYSGFGEDAAPAGVPAGTPNQAQLLALWNQHKTKMTATARRVNMLVPNADSTVKIEGYSFSIATAQVFLPVAANTNFTATGFPKTDIRPVRIIMNIPSVNFAFIQQIEVSNVNAVVGVSEDAFKYSTLSVGTQMSLPRMLPSTPATVTGFYSGLNPFGATVSYQMTISFEGPATVAGGHADV